MTNPQTTKLLTIDEAHRRLVDRLTRLEMALVSIAKNTCCDNCQEAAKVAREALAYD